MADKSFHVKLITPESRVLDSQAAYVQVPMWDGMRGFMANAGAVVGKLGFGELRVELVDRYEVGVKLEEAGNKRWFIAGGFMQFVNNELTILASSATPAEELNVEEAKAELAEAVAHKSIDTLQMDRITEERSKARAKLAMARN